MAQQFTSFAFGNSTNGGFVIGGENAGKQYTLVDWFPSYNETQVSVSIDFWIQGDTDAEFKNNLTAVKGIMRNTQIMGITTKPTDRKITVDLTLSTRELTLTKTAGDAFASTDLGLPVEIYGVGSFQITTFTSTSVVTCEIAPTLTLPTAATGKIARIGTNFLRVEESTHTNGFRSRSTLSEDPDQDSSTRRKRYSLEVNFERPASDVRGTAYAQRREASYRVFTAPSGIRMAEFSGSYTAGGGSTATANYSSGVTTWINSIITVLTGDWGKASQDMYSVDDENHIISFTATRREIGFDQSAAGADHDAIENAEVSMSISYDNTHGLKGHNSPGVVTIDYKSEIVRSEATEAAVRTLWTGTIRPHLIAKCKAIFGSGSAIVESGMEPGIDLQANTISATMRVMLPGTGSKIIDYQRVADYSLDGRLVFRDIHDGKSSTFNSWDPGSVIEANISISITKLKGKIGPGTGSGGSGGVIQVGSSSGGSPRIGFFGVGGVLNISFGGSGGGSSLGSEKVPSKLETYPKPADPNTILGDVGKGDWVATTKTARIIPKSVGGRDGLERADISVEVYTQGFRWVSSESKKSQTTPDKGRQGSGHVEASSHEHTVVRANPKQFS